MSRIKDLMAAGLSYGQAAGPGYQAAHRKAAKAYRQRKLAAGLCACGRTPQRGRHRCRKCAQAESRRKQRLRAKRLAMGLCQDCRRIRAPLSAGYCALHQKANRLRVRKHFRLRRGIPLGAPVRSGRCSICGGGGHDRRNCLLGGTR